jgi:two-component system, LytTR family, response regulator AgrA
MDGGTAMLNIYICEDNDVQRENFNKIVDFAISRDDLNAHIAVSTKDPDKIIDYVDTHRGVGVYILDIDLRCDINGIQLGEKIRKLDQEGFIIFATTHAEMSYLTFKYKVEAMDYIIKEDFADLKTRIEECLLEAHTRYISKIKNGNSDNFVLDINDRIISIKFDDILFFETSDTVHKVRVHAVNKQLEFYAQLKDIEEKLDNRFYRCHKAFIVNRNNIQGIDKLNRIIHMTNGENCLVSVRALKGLLKSIT